MNDENENIHLTNINVGRILKTLSKNKGGPQERRLQQQILEQNRQRLLQEEQQQQRQQEQQRQQQQSSSTTTTTTTTSGPRNYLYMNEKKQAQQQHLYRKLVEETIPPLTNTKQQNTYIKNKLANIEPKYAPTSANMPFLRELVFGKKGGKRRNSTRKRKTRSRK